MRLSDGKRIHKSGHNAESGHVDDGTQTKFSLINTLNTNETETLNNLKNKIDKLEHIKNISKLAISPNKKVLTFIDGEGNKYRYQFGVEIVIVPGSPQNKYQKHTSMDVEGDNEFSTSINIDKIVTEISDARNKLILSPYQND